MARIYKKNVGSKTVTLKYEVQLRQIDLGYFKHFDMIYFSLLTSLFRHHIKLHHQLTVKSDIDKILLKTYVLNYEAYVSRKKKKLKTSLTERLRQFFMV